MTDLSQADWSETDSSNNAASPNGWASGTMLPSQVEPAARAMRGAMKRWWNRINSTQTSTGSANVYALTYAVASPSYTTGEVFRFFPNFTNTGAATLNINGLGAKAIQYKGASLVGGEISSGGATVRYDGTAFQLESSNLLVSSTALAAVAASGSATDLATGSLPPPRLNATRWAGTLR